MDDHKLFERLETQGVIENGMVKVTYVSGGDYKVDDMQYGHNLELRNHEFSIESEVSLEILLILDKKEHLEKIRWIRMRTYDPIGLKSLDFSRILLEWNRKLLELLSGIRSTCRGIIVNGGNKDDRTADITQVVQNTARRQ